MRTKAGGGGKKSARGGARRRADFLLWLLLGLTFAAFVAMVAIPTYQRLTLSGPFRVEYEGRIVDKILTLRETEFGTYPVTGLLVEGADGRRFKVAINRHLYDRAEVGMWIKSTRDGAALSWERPVGGAPQAAGAEHPQVSAPTPPARR